VPSQLPAIEQQPYGASPRPGDSHVRVEYSMERTDNHDACEEGCVPQFKIRHVDGSEQVITATRIVTNGEHTVFHGRGAPDQIIHQMSAGEIASVRRRIRACCGVT